MAEKSAAGSKETKWAPEKSYRGEHDKKKCRRRHGSCGGDSFNLNRAKHTATSLHGLKVEVLQFDSFPTEI